MRPAQRGEAISADCVPVTSRELTLTIARCEQLSLLLTAGFVGHGLDLCKGQWLLCCCNVCCCGTNLY